ncbi:hypothetical protein E2P81_ATG10568 [Venturia nashicola]|nr:hypothetical protein E2P81_ATG10568 [Venturia nashicola]
MGGFSMQTFTLSMACGPCVFQAQKHVPSICATLNARPTNEQQSSGCSSLSQVELSMRKAAKVHKDGEFGNPASRTARTASSQSREDSVSRDPKLKYHSRVFLEQTTQPANMTAE